MATSAQRRLRPKEIRRFGSLRAIHAIPELTEIQTRFYDAFLQHEVPQNKRKDHSFSPVSSVAFTENLKLSESPSASIN